MQPTQQGLDDVRQILLLQHILEQHADQFDNVGVGTGDLASIDALVDLFALAGKRCAKVLDDRLADFDIAGNVRIAHIGAVGAHLLLYIADQADQ